jgi:cis-3-alkyl-4-acyloxetan-2-one decarboxylase
MSFPETSAFFTQPDGLRQAYLDVGHGAPVLCVHGNPSWSYYFHPLLRLADRHRLIVPDHIGMGRSDPPAVDAPRRTYGERIADLDRLLSHLALDQPLTLVVHDWGGLIGLRWAVLNPERVARVVILNTAAFPLLKGKRLPWTIALTRNTRIGAWLARRWNAFARGAADYGVRQRLSREVRAQLLAPYADPARRETVLNFVRDIPLKPADPGHAELVDTASRLDAALAGKPVLLLWGLRDFVFDRDYLAEFRRRLPHAEVEALVDAGHYVLLDAPEWSAQRIGRFCDDHPAAIAA